MREVVAFSPGHITGIFRIHDQPEDSLKKGSWGAGVSIARGVTTRVHIKTASENSFIIRINGKTAKYARVSEHVVNTFLSHTKKNHKIIVDHDVEVPVGSGFGSSGAGALSLSLALNEAFGLDFSRTEAAQVAHIAEVECKTGLGTVIAEASGGLEIRTEPGGPGVGEVRNIPVGEDYVVVCVSLGPVSTREVLADEEFRQLINEFGRRLLDQLIAEPKPHVFMNLSREFAEGVGLISPRIRKVLRETDSEGLTCSMAMLGESVFSLVRRDELEELLKIFRKHAASEDSIIVSDIDFQGARLLD
jgi:pantoate kinase